ncbi:hypothetical protein LAZ67_3004646 [Cordylochernes scorpioides]|uniref:Uncharacterized protein n=1 Tax=Cordylochernes scorpioides TaxID=51811 RepID=A0ABY6KAM7_9ARAC|nr:hypothetical protein LAZ67_3004646 [Cordylochernes scorpioides]
MALEKNKRKFEDTIQDTLSRILLTYRCTPHETTGKTPSELFMASVMPRKGLGRLTPQTVSRANMTRRRNNTPISISPVPTADIIEGLGIVCPNCSALHFPWKLLLYKRQKEIRILKNIGNEIGKYIQENLEIFQKVYGGTVKYEFKNSRLNKLKGVKLHHEGKECTFEMALKNRGHQGPKTRPKKKVAAIRT